MPEKVIIDNPKCAITKACFHDPQVQRAYAEYAESYGFRIAPCPVADPQKKGIVKSGVNAEGFVQIFHDAQLVACHERERQTGRHVTVQDHRPPAAQAYFMADPQHCLEQAEN